MNHLPRTPHSSNVELDTLAILKGYMDAYPKNPNDNRSM